MAHAFADELSCERWQYSSPTECDREEYDGVGQGSGEAGCGDSCSPPAITEFRSVPQGRVDRKVEQLRDGKCDCRCGGDERIRDQIRQDCADSEYCEHLRFAEEVLRRVSGGECEAGGECASCRSESESDWDESESGGCPVRDNNGGEECCCG